MPTLIKPKSQRKGRPAVTSDVYHIRFFCPVRRRSVVISTRCKSRRNAEACLREFVDLLERGEVGLEKPLLARHRKRAEEADRLPRTGKGLTALPGRPGTNTNGLEVIPRAAPR